MAPALRMSNNEDPFDIETDGLGIGIGVILSQQQGNCWHPIAIISHLLNNTEQNYHTTDLEMAAIIFTLKEWHQYFLDAKHPFMILTDHKNLEYFMKPQDLSCRQAVMIFLSFLPSPYRLTISLSTYGYHITWSPM